LGLQEWWKKGKPPAYEPCTPTLPKTFLLFVGPLLEVWVDNPTLAGREGGRREEDGATKHGKSDHVIVVGHQHQW